MNMNMNTDILNKDIPNGGFPPIIICDNIKNKDKQIKREFKTKIKSVSIKDIIEKKQDVIPFINVD